MWAPLTVALLIGFFGNLTLDRTGAAIVFLVLAAATIATTVALRRNKAA
ncbi:hypothetical protein ABZU76_46950 [Amycolatopsis sp. NPDC005232]|nr:hypothetical protein [Amycolatopsis sp. DSM 110486]QYN22295.1 hypothetical protein K1T34_07365 [Amycolatopsis sp. DSM 110486]